MEEKVEQNERMIKASTEIDEEFSGDRLASDFKRLEKVAGSVSADQRLLELKQKMGLLPPGGATAPRRIGAGEETVHAEVEDTRPEKK
jgi:phage shock protein A